MTSTDDKKHIHPDIPTDIAWQTGRRIYIRCGYKSRLNAHLLEVGSNWDAELRVRWVGTTKRDRIIDQVLEHAQRVAHVKQVKKQNLWVAIPYEDAETRALASELGGVFSKEHSRGYWYMPDQASLETIRRRVGGAVRHPETGELMDPIRDPRTGQYVYPDQDGFEDTKAAAEAARAEAERAVIERRRAEAEAVREDERRSRERIAGQVLERSGRTPAGDADPVVWSRKMTAHGRRDEVARHAARVGDVIERRGRRGLVVAVDLVFNSRHHIDEGLGGDPWDDPHWEERLSVIIVEPTEDEREADRQRRAAAQDNADRLAYIGEVQKFMTGPRSIDTYDVETRVDPDVTITHRTRGPGGGVSDVFLQVDTRTGTAATYDRYYHDDTDDRWVWQLDADELEFVQRVVDRGDVEARPSYPPMSTVAVTVAGEALTKDTLSSEDNK